MSLVYILWLPFISLLAKFAIAVSPATSGVEGAARLAAEVPRQIANANTLFNLLNTLVLIGFTGWFARCSTWLIPSRREEHALVKPQFLDPAALAVPAVALEQVRQELGRLGEIVRAMMDELREGTGACNPRPLAGIAMHNTQVAALERALLEFLGHIRQGTLTEAESQAHLALMTATVHLRALADIIADDLVGNVQTSLSRPDLTGKLEFAAFSELAQAVQRALGLAVKAVGQQDAAAANEAESMSGQVRGLAEALMYRLAAGLDAGDARSIAALRLQINFVDGLRQVFTLVKRIARTVAPVSGATPH